jgi:prevent-host-death family protein
MTTKTIGIKEFRADISNYAKKARKGDVRYIVMNRNKPLFELKPFAENDGLEEIFMDIQKSKEDMRGGRLHSQGDILAEFS